MAEFPISVLQRQQPADTTGRKLDTITYRSTRYDPTARRRVPQSVTLTTNSRSGLPTPADENVFLALLYLTKRANNFTDPKVHFVPWQLFRLMGWAPNSRSYERMREVLRRLKSLMLIYNNAWWDKQGRAFATEFATGLIAAYEIVQQTAGRKKAGSVPPSWVLWNPDFFESLRAGSLKRLNLKEVFSLKLPTSQQMYRFLDKHFYYSETLELDLREFACGHIGLSEAYNVGQVKRKLQPAIAELEQIGFIEPASRHQRYRKIKPGVWRIVFRKRLKSQQPQQVDKTKQGSESSLEAELTQRGVTARTARQLIDGHPAQFLREKIGVFDWLMESHDPKVSRNPAGYLVKSIAENYTAPGQYESSAQREAKRREERQRREAFERQKTEEAARLNRQWAAVDDYLASLSTEDRRQLERDALAQEGNILVKQLRTCAHPETRHWLHTTIVRQYAKGRLDSRTAV